MLSVKEWKKKNRKKLRQEIEWSKIPSDQVLQDLN